MRRRARRILAAVMTLSCAVLAGAQPARGAAAPDYPARPVRWVVPFPPGASNDIIARLIGQKLTDAWGQQFVVDNRPGAGGSLGAETVAKASPDGYTLLLANPGPNVNNPLMRRDTPYKIEHFAPIVFLGYAPLIIVAHPKFPPNTARELIDYAKVNPGKVNWGSSGNGSSLHIGLALFQAATGAKVVHVPYKGAAPALTDVVGGQINLMYTTTVSGEAHIKSGRVKVLANAGSKRQAVIPNVPTLAEQGIQNAEAMVWFGAAAPARTPRNVIDKLNREINRALALADVKSRLDQLGLETEGGSSEDFQRFIDREAGRLRRLIQSGAIRTE
jgi:tripartite-type tricarboxylate transporter receptor subunit TctC